MLLEQLAELIDFGMVEKKSYEGFPLKTEYSLTARGVNMLQAITIMQGIGIDLMLENGMDDVLRSAGFLE